MKIGIIGSGPVGRTIGTGLIRAGHDITIGTAHPDKAELLDWAGENKNAGKISTFAATAAFGELIFLCTSWSGTDQAIRLCGVNQFRSKVVVDTTNPLDGKGPDAQGRLSYASGSGRSGGQQVQQWLPQAKVVKALNSIGNSYMDHPIFEDGNPTMFIAGNDGEAKKTTTHILHQLGWEDVADMGNIEMSDGLEELCRLWCAYGFRTGTWKHAFRLIKK